MLKCLQTLAQRRRDAPVSPQSIHQKIFTINTQCLVYQVVVVPFCGHQYESAADRSLFQIRWNAKHGIVEPIVYGGLIDPYGFSIVLLA